MAVYRLSQRQCYHLGAEIESTEYGGIPGGQLLKGMR
jgi:hypothetical protein